MAKRVFSKREVNPNIIREAIKNQYLLKYYNLFMNSYKFTGIDYQQKDYLLRKLWATGTIACISRKIVDIQQLVFCPYATSKLNLYDFPVDVTLINTRNVPFIPKGFQKVDEDVVLIWGMRNKRSILEMVMAFIEKIVDVEMILRTNLRSHKTPWVIAYTPESQLQREQLRNMLDDDDPMLFLDIDSSNAKALVSGAPYIADKLYNLKQCYENELREFLGINNMGVNEKKEHLITGEIEVNNEIVVSSGECFLDCLKEACQRIKEVFGYDISVELNKPDEMEYNEDEEDDPQDKEEQA